MNNDEEEILKMFKNNNDGLAFEEIQANEKFQPEAFTKGKFLMKMGVDLVTVLRHMVEDGRLIDRQGKYYLNKNRR